MHRHSLIRRKSYAQSLTSYWPALGVRRWLAAGLSAPELQSGHDKKMCG